VKRVETIRDRGSVRTARALIGACVVIVLRRIRMVRVIGLQACEQRLLTILRPSRAVIAGLALPVRVRTRTHRVRHGVDGVLPGAVSTAREVVAAGL
jgi:hypothetical protein